MVEQVEAKRDTGGLETFAELGHDAGGVEAAFDVAAGPKPEFLKDVDVLKAHDISGGSGDLADVGDAAAPVTHARDLDDEINGRSDLGADSLLGQRDRSHHRHRFDAGDGIAGIVSVNGGDGSVVACIHGLQHVERLFPSNLAEDDSIGAHAKRIDDEFALADGAFAFEVGRPALEARDVFLFDLEFGGVFDGDDALRGGDESREYIEQRGLAGAGASRDDDVEPSADCAAQDFEHLRSQGAVAQQIVGGERNGAEATYREQRTIHRERRNNDVDG